MSAKEQEEISVVVEEKLQQLFRILKAIKDAEDKRRHHLYRTPQDMKDVETFSYFSRDPWEYFGFRGERTTKATTKDEGGKKPSEVDEILQRSFQIHKDTREEDSVGYLAQNSNQQIGIHGPPKEEEERKSRKKKQVV
ncbi:hypothetical protein GW17_00062149 [Ensete ventricosum]|nr:hypothetical protein GW17_00062149 [Ensete ventricosum]